MEKQVQNKDKNQINPDIPAPGPFSDQAIDTIPETI